MTSSYRDICMKVTPQSINFGFTVDTYAAKIAKKKISLRPSPYLLFRLHNTHDTSVQGFVGKMLA